MRALTLLALPLLAGCASVAPQADAPLPAQGVRGVLTHRGAPLPGAVVYAYRRPAANLLGPADFASAPSDARGRYVLDLVEGSYWLAARKRLAGGGSGPLVPGDLQAVHPGNPVVVRPGELAAVDFTLEEMRDLMFSRSTVRGRTSTGVRGRITDAAGRPVAWVFAIVYTTPDTKRVPDFTSAMTGEDGKYVVYLPGGGRYWVGARKHIRERPAAGEPYGLYGGSPDHSVEVGEGEFLDGIDVTLGDFRKDDEE